MSTMDYEWNDEFVSQKARVRAWLLEGHTLTPLEALRMFGSLRLSAIIFDLREEGLPIVTEKIQVAPRKRVAEYSLPKEFLSSLEIKL